jgi:proteasome lid subunit RPN8/RPN11
VAATLTLPTALRAQIAREARLAFPRECCGLIEGLRDGAAVRATTLHPTRNLAAEPDRFEIDPAEHIRLLRALRGTDREIVGCYHSHPQGRAETSPRDRADAREDGFVWLIAAVDGGRDIDLAATTFAATGWCDLRLDDGERVACV